MMEWKEYKFTEAATLINGRAYLQPELQTSGKYKIVRVGNLSGGDKWFYSDMELPEDKYCHKGDLLYAWACSFGPYIWNEDKTIYHYHIWKVDVNKTLTDKSYLYYYLKYYTPKWMGLTNGSVMMHITKGSLEKQLIRLPDLDTQRNIASILSSLDDKIAVNKKICENLEAQAQALFKHWFVDFAPFKDGKFVESELGLIPEGWRVGKVEDFCNVFTGKKDVNQSSDRGKYPFFSCSPKHTYSDEYLYDGESIIIAGNGSYTGRTSFFIGKYDLYQRTYSCTIKQGYNKKYFAFLYFMMKCFFEPVKMGGTRGSSIPYIVMKDITQQKFPLNDEYMEAFSEIVYTILINIQNKMQESSRLATLRDTLLPKLMSGQIKL